MELPKKMWAGVVDGRIYTTSTSADEYAPLSVAIYHSRAEAKRHFEKVIELDPSTLLVGSWTHELGAMRETRE